MSSVWPPNRPPFRNVNVFIALKDSNNTFLASTDSLGEVKFKDLIPGFYTVVMSLNAYATKEYTSVVSKDRITFHLFKLETKESQRRCHMW